jgi:hypothetical protein
VLYLSTVGLAVLTAISCATSNSPEGVRPQTPLAAARVINPTRSASEIDVRVGEVIQVRRPADFARWQVDFAGEVLRPSGPPGELATPGPDGWTFSVIGEGVCELMLTAEPAPGPVSPVSPSPPRFTVTIRSSR